MKLARTEQALIEAEKEIDRQRCAAAEAAAEAEIPEGAKALIAAVSKVDLPAFWDADPVLWFRQCESAFRRAGTVSSGVKFDHVVGKLPNAVSLSCRSLLLSIHFEDKDTFERLKEHLCKNYSKSKWQQGYSLLDHHSLGDHLPSQLLQDMLALLPDKEAECVLFQCLFLKRLPTSMSDALMAAGLENIEDMAAMADRLHDKPAAAQPPCCTHVSAIDSRQRKFNRSSRSPNRSGRSPDRCAATPRLGKDKKDFTSFFAAGRPASQWVKGADKTWCPDAICSDQVAKSAGKTKNVVCTGTGTGTSTVPQSMLRKQNPGSPWAAAAHSGHAFDPMGARLGPVKRVRFSCGNTIIPQVFNPSPPTFKPHPDPDLLSVSGRPRRVRRSPDRLGISVDPLGSPLGGEL